MEVSLNVMKCPPQSLFMSALHPACFSHFDFSSLNCPTHFCVFASFYSLQGPALLYHLCMFKKCMTAFYVNYSPTARTSQTFVSVIFLSPPSSAGTWAPTGGPGDKCWCVSRVWPRWPVAGLHQTAHQRGIFPRCPSGPCGHLLWLCASERYTGGHKHSCKGTHEHHLIRAICNCNVLGSK